MDLPTFCRELPKVELHAHLNGSLSGATLLQLQRNLADSGLVDKTDGFLNKFHVGSGDNRNLSECFETFSIAHSMTVTPAALALATRLTLQEFQDDGCCYVELRSTPRETPHMTRRQYIETIIEAMLKASRHLTIIAKYIISIDRKQSIDTASEITELAIEYHRKYPNVVVGLELSGDPIVGQFIVLQPYFVKARDNGLKISLHCGEVCNTKEIAQMLDFHPDRIGHGTCIIPRLCGTEETWVKLQRMKIPVEICLTSNLRCKTIDDYALHHFKELYEANVPVMLCTDDKGVFCTSLSEEYRICGESFSLSRSQLARLALNACQHVFAEDCRKILNDKVLNFINKHAL